MLISMAILGSFVAIACGMTKRSCCWHAWLNSWCSCTCCGACVKCCCCCCASAPTLKEKDADKATVAVGSSQPDWVLRTFSWVRPIGPAGSELVIFQRQLGLLLWKSFLEKSRQKKAVGLYFGIPMLILLVCLLTYGSFNSWASSGTIELFVVPFGFVVALQLPTVSLVSEKSARLKESMRMMGMREAPYWASYFVADGVFMGGLLSLVLTTTACFMKLFWNLGASNHEGGLAPFVEFAGMFWFLWCYCLALTALAFLLSTVVDAPQTAGQMALFSIIAGVVTFLIFLFSPALLDSALGTAAKQATWCLFPPMALQVGLYANSYFACQGHRIGREFVSLSTISGMLLLDVVLYSLLAWYLAQVLPSEYGVQQPPWFLFLPSYWRGTDPVTPGAATGGGGVAGSANPLLAPLTFDGTSDADRDGCPTEEVDRALAPPTVEVRGLRKTFNLLSMNPFKAVDGLSFDLYEGQIFSLLGHNGAGKTTTINCLTGLFPPDGASGATTVCGHDIATDMVGARKALGVCPQHDVLFEHLTAREHVVFAALMKGVASRCAAAEEADVLLKQFHLHERAHHVGSELSGGMKVNAHAQMSRNNTRPP